MPMTSNFSTNLGRMPVGLSRPWILPSTTPVCSKTKTSCMTMTSPSMPWTSVMLMIWRVPSLRRLCWTIRSTAEAICSRMARSGRSTPAIRTIVSRRDSMSRGLLAWPVDIEPSWPVFMAWSMSSASPERHSPTMMRSGRMRRALRTSSRIGTAPLPSMFGGRDSSVTTCSWRSCSSAASSMVTMRSSFGMKDESTLSVVVLPEPVPPETKMLRRASTHARRKSNISAVAVPNRIRSSTVNGDAENFRIVMTGPDQRQRRDDRVDAGAVGQAGIDHRARLVDAAADRGDDPVDDAHDVVVVLEDDVGELELAGALDVDLARAVDHDLGDRSSRRSGSSGPRPMISSVICSSIRTRSARVRARPSSSMTLPKISSIWRRTSTWLDRSSFGSRSWMTRFWMRNLTSRNDSRTGAWLVSLGEGRRGRRTPGATGRLEPGAPGAASGPVDPGRALSIRFSRDIRLHPFSPRGAHYGRVHRHANRDFFWLDFWLCPQPARSVARQ